MEFILRKAFSFPIFLGALLVAGVFACARLLPPDPDTWWHIAVGEQILRQGTWPTKDVYSFTVFGNAWMAYEWLGEVVMALAARLGGLTARTALLIGLSSLVFLLLYYYSYLRSGNAKAGFVACAILLPVAGFFFTLRPQLIGYIFLLITLICLERFRQGRQKSLWMLPIVFLIWVNTHGSFAFGLFALGLYGVSGLVSFHWGGLVAELWTVKQRRHLAVTFLLSVVALTVTPYGLRLAAYPMEMALFQPVNIASIREWQPLSPDLLMGKLFVGLLLLFFLAHVLFRPNYRLEEIVLLLFAVFSASVHRRFFLLLIFLLAPVVATLLARWLPPYQPTKDHPLLNAILMLLVAAGLVAFFPSQRALESVVAQNYPQKAVGYLRQHPVGGPMLNEYGWGGYLIWSLSPNHRVFIDGRADIYEYGGVLSDYMSITHLKPDTLPLLRKHGVEACLIQSEAPLGTLLAAMPDWEQVYRDELSVIYVHKKSHPSSVGDSELSPGNLALATFRPKRLARNATNVTSRRP